MRRRLAALLALGLLAAVPSASHSAVPPGTLVFSSTRADFLHDEILVVDPASGRRRNLSRHPGQDTTPAPSPDGRRVAFVTDRGGRAIWIVPSAGGTPRPFAGPRIAADEWRSIGNLGWDTTGRLLVYTVWRGQSAGVYVRSPSGDRLVARGAQTARIARDGRIVVVRLGAVPNVAVYDPRGRRLWRRNGLDAWWSSRGELAVTGRNTVTVYARDGRRRVTLVGAAPAWSPDGRRLALLRSDGVRLWEDGRVRRLVARRPELQVAPVWSPDGRRLVFLDSRYRTFALDLRGRLQRLGEWPYDADWARDGRIAAGGGTLSVARLGGRPRVVARGTGGPCPGFFSRVRWLPNGRLVTTYGHEGKQQADIWTSAVGGQPRRLAGDGNQWESAPVSSPDGSRVVYERGHVHTHASSCDGPMDPRLWIADGNGGRPRPLTQPQPDEDRQPAWSPDGNLVAFARLSISEIEGTGIFVVDVASGREQRVTSSVGGSFDRNPAWAPDGKRLAFERGPSVYVVPLTGGAPQRVAAGSRPAWSSAGKLAYVARSRLVVSNPDGSETRTSTGASGSPRWAPDGRRLAVPNGNRLVVVDAAGTARVVARGRTIVEIAWSRDGKRIAFTAETRHRGHGELYVVPAAGGRVVQVTDDDAIVQGIDWRP